MKSSCRGTTTRCSSPILRPASANRQRHFITPTPSAVARRASSACKRTRATRSRGGIFASSHSRQRPTRAGRVASLALAGSASCVSSAEEVKRNSVGEFGHERHRVTERRGWQHPKWNGELYVFHKLWRKASRRAYGSENSEIEN